MTWLRRILPLTACALLWLLVHAPTEALARPMEPAHGASLGRALIGGVGSPMCVAAALLVLSCVAASLLSPRSVWRIAAGVGGAVTIGFTLVLARASGGHTLTTHLTLVAGVAGLIVPALGAAVRLSTDVASQSSVSMPKFSR